MGTFPLLVTVLISSWNLYMTLGVGPVTAGTAAPGATKAPATAPAPVTMFMNNHDRDNFIMKLSSDMLDMKNMMSTLFDKLTHLSTNPTGAGGSNPSSFVAFMVRLSNRVSGLGQDQIIHFDDVILNKGDGFDNRLGVFRCPLAGTYQFSLSIGSYGGIQLEIVNNGQQIGRVFTSRSRFGRDLEEDVEEEEVNEEEERSIDKRQYSKGATVAAGGGGGYGTGTAATMPAGGMGYVQPGSEATPGSAQAIVDLQVGDEVWVKHASDNQHDILFGNGMTTFSGNLLSLSKK